MGVEFGVKWVSCSGIHEVMGVVIWVLRIGSCIRWNSYENIIRISVNIANKNYFLEQNIN